MRWHDSNKNPHAGERRGKENQSEAKIIHFPLEKQESVAVASPFWQIMERNNGMYPQLYRKRDNEGPNAYFRRIKEETRRIWWHSIFGSLPESYRQSLIAEGRAIGILDDRMTDHLCEQLNLTRH